MHQHFFRVVLSLFGRNLFYQYQNWLYSSVLLYSLEYGVYLFFRNAWCQRNMFNVVDHATTLPILIEVKQKTAHGSLSSSRSINCCRIAKLNCHRHIYNVDFDFVRRTRLTILLLKFSTECKAVIPLSNLILSIRKIFHGRDINLSPQFPLNTLSVSVSFYFTSWVYRFWERLDLTKICSSS